MKYLGLNPLNKVLYYLLCLFTSNKHYALGLNVTIIKKINNCFPFFMY